MNSNHLSVGRMFCCLLFCLLIVVEDFVGCSNQSQSQKLKQQQQTRSRRQQNSTTPASSNQPPRRQQLGGEDEYLIGVGLGDITGPAADINLVSLLTQIARLVIDGSGGGNQNTFFTPPTATITSGTSILNDLMRIQHPSWRELSDVKLQLKINMNSLLLRLDQLLETNLAGLLTRWAMPSRIKMQAEYTYANLVVQL